LVLSPRAGAPAACCEVELHKIIAPQHIKGFPCQRLWTRKRNKVAGAGST